MKKFKQIALGLIALLAISQFFSPKKNEGSLASLTPFVEETKPSKTVETILKDACYDCHTNHTKYPWYNKITPINFWLAGHINEGKEHLNFSNWNNYNTNQKSHILEEVYEEVERRKMPLKTYTLTHAEAKLSQEQIDKVVSWAKLAKQQYK